MGIILTVRNHFNVYKGFCIYSLMSFNHWTIVRIGMMMIKVFVQVQGSMRNLVILMRLGVTLKGPDYQAMGFSL